MKQELLRRWRERNMPGVVHDETIANWIIDIVADARELELSETMAVLRGLDIETPAIRIEVDQPVYDPEEAAQRIHADIEAITARIVPGMLVLIDGHRRSRVSGSLQDQLHARRDDAGRVACHDGDFADWIEPERLMPDISCRYTLAALQAVESESEDVFRERVRKNTINPNHHLAGPTASQPPAAPERKTYDPKDVEVTIGDGVGDPRQHEGFAMTTELTGSIERASVTITAEYMEKLWEAEARVQVVDIVSTTSAGRIGRFDLVTHDDGSVWAWTLEEPGVTVMVVKPDPEAGQ